MTSTDGPLRGEHEMDADGARHLREAGDRFFDVGLIEHHQVGELVDDDHDVGQGLFFLILVEKQSASDCRTAGCTDRCCGREREASSLRRRSISTDGVAQSVGGEFGLGDDGREEVRDSLVHAQLDALGIDQDQAHLLRRCLVEHRHDHGVDGHGFAAASGSSDEHVGHRGEVGDDDAAVDVFAHGEGELASDGGKVFRLDDVAQPDGFALVVRHLNADGAFAGHALDEDGFSAGGKAKVFGKAGDAAVFDAGVGAEFEGSDDRAGIDLDDLADHVELRAFFHQRLGCVRGASSSRTGEGSSLRWSRVLGGRRNPLTVFRSNRDALDSVSARSPIEMGVGSPALGTGSRNQLRARRRGGLVASGPPRWNRARDDLDQPRCRWSYRPIGSGSGCVVSAKPYRPVGIRRIVLALQRYGDRRFVAVAGFRGLFSSFAGLLQFLFVDTVEFGGSGGVRDAARGRGASSLKRSRHARKNASLTPSHSRAVLKLKVVER